jgi:hypothetical protein
MPDSPNLLVNSPNVGEQAISLIHSLAFRTKLNVKVLGYIRNSLYISIRKLRDMKTIHMTNQIKDLIKRKLEGEQLDNEDWLRLHSWVLQNDQEYSDKVDEQMKIDIKKYIPKED